MAKKGAAAVDRALSIVTALGDARRALTLTETASATGLYKSTALRLLASGRGALRLHRGRFLIAEEPRPREESHALG